MLHARTAHSASPLGPRLSVKGSTFDRSLARTDLAVWEPGSLGAWLDTPAVLSLRLTERASTSTTHNKATTRWVCKYGVLRQVLHSTEPHESQDGRRTECLPACLPARLCTHALTQYGDRSKYQTEPHRWRQVP